MPIHCELVNCTKCKQIKLMFESKATCAICGIAEPMRTQFSVLDSAWQRTELALVPPATTAVAAALGFGAGYSAARGHLTHGLQYFSETEALSII